MDYPILTTDQLRSYIVSLRVNAGYSQAELGELLGISQQGYQNLEKNPDRVSFNRIWKVLQLLQASLVIRDRSENTSVAAPNKEAIDKVSADMLKKRSDRTQRRMSYASVGQTSPRESTPGPKEHSTSKKDRERTPLIAPEGHYAGGVTLKVPTGKKAGW